MIHLKAAVLLMFVLAFLGLFCLYPCVIGGMVILGALYMGCVSFCRPDPEIYP